MRVPTLCVFAAMSFLACIEEEQDENQAESAHHQEGHLDPAVEQATTSSAIRGLVEAFEGEERDDAWAPAAEAALIEGWEAFLLRCEQENLPVVATLRRLECRTSCMVHASFSENVGLEILERELIDQASVVMPGHSGSLRTEASGNGIELYVFQYRPEGSLP